MKRKKAEQRRPDDLLMPKKAFAIAGVFWRFAFRCY
jgi:hypothetical protein